MSYCYPRLQECARCGCPVADERDPLDMWLLKRDAMEGTGSADIIGGWDGDDEPVCETCWSDPEPTP